METGKQEALRDLYSRVSPIFANSATDRSKYNSLRQILDQWVYGAHDTTVNWREGIKARIWEISRGFDQAAFRNMNLVRPKALWNAMYSNRVLAIRNTFYALARQYAENGAINGLAQILKHPNQELRELPPGSYTVKCVDVKESIRGVKASFVIIDEIGTLNDSVWTSWSEEETPTETEMNEQDKEIIAMFKNVKTVRAVFNGSTQRYDYLTDIEDIKVDDILVVEANGSTQLVKAVEIVDGATDKANKWIVDKIDFTAYKERLAKIERSKLIKKELDAAVERKRKMIDYEAIIGEDEGLKKLLAEFKELQG